MYMQHERNEKITTNHYTQQQICNSCTQYELQGGLFPPKGERGGGGRAPPFFYFITPAKGRKPFLRVLVLRL